MRIRGIKGKRRKEKGTFAIEESWRKREKERKPEKREKERKPEKRKKEERSKLRNQHLLERKRGDLAFQKSSYTQIISEGEVRNSFSVYNK